MTSEAGAKALSVPPGMEYSAWGWLKMTDAEKERLLAQTIVELERAQRELAGLRADLARQVRNWSEFARALSAEPRTAHVRLKGTFDAIDKESLVRTVESINDLEGRQVALAKERDGYLESL